MSVKKRGKKWVAMVYDPKTRGRVWCGTHDLREDAKEAEREAIVRLKTARKRGTETVELFAERWMRDFPRNKESTTVWYEGRIKAVTDEFGERLLTDIDRTEARQWARRNPNWKIARAMFSDAKRDGLCEINPFAEMRLPESRGRRDLVVPTEAQLGSIDHLEPPEDGVPTLLQAAVVAHEHFGRRVYGPMLQFAAYSGLRLGELAGLAWRDIDRHGRTVRVERQWNARLGKMTTPKNGLTRTVYLTPPAQAAIERVPLTDPDCVFPTAKGKRFGGSVSHYYWHPVRVAVGRPDLDFHGLRHYFGTHLALLGVGPVEIAQAMGHTDGGRIAMQRYIHMTEQDARAKIARAFGSSGQLQSVPTGANGEHGHRKGAL